MTSEPLFRFLRIPYDTQNSAYWGRQTSTLNFCEEDYVISRYIAEFCNTISNFPFIILGLWGIWNCIKEKHPLVYALTFTVYLIVGLGSSAFHATLKYPMQLVDELAMIYATALIVYASITFRRTKVSQVIIAFCLLLPTVGVSIYYYRTKNPVFHQIIYGAMTLFVVGRGQYLVSSELRPKLQKYKTDEETSAIVKKLYSLLFTGSFMFLCGFLLWISDNELCDMWIETRHKIGLPFAVLLEGHAWWHLLTGVGAYYHIVYEIWLHHCLTGSANRYTLSWTSFVLPLPKIVRETKKACKFN